MNDIIEHDYALLVALVLFYIALFYIIYNHFRTEQLND